MLISEFAKATGLSRETVRYYVRFGLLRPETNGKGGRNPYQFFTEEDLRAAEVIRVGQALGLSLKAIAALDAERRGSGIEGLRLLEILTGQLAQLEAKAAELDVMTRYLRAKIDGLKAGGPPSQPGFGACGCEAMPARQSA
jgi:DNA-binding transcriptional MerR regulator